MDYVTIVTSVRLIDFSFIDAVSASLLFYRGIMNLLSYYERRGNRIVKRSKYSACEALHGESSPLAICDV